MFKLIKLMLSAFSPVRKLHVIVVYFTYLVAIFYELIC